MVIHRHLNNWILKNNVRVVFVKFILYDIYLPPLSCENTPNQKLSIQACWHFLHWARNPDVQPEKCIDMYLICSYTQIIKYMHQLTMPGLMLFSHTSWWLAISDVWITLTNFASPLSSLLPTGSPSNPPPKMWIVIGHIIYCTKY